MFHTWEDAAAEVLAAFEAAQHRVMNNAGKNAVAPRAGHERADILAPSVQRAVEAILRRAEEPMSSTPDVMLRSFVNACLDTIQVVQDDVWSIESVREMLVGAGRFGYATRLFEETTLDAAPRVRVIELGIASWRLKHPDNEPVAILMVVCNNLATADTADPWAGVRAVDAPPEGFRTTVAARTALPWIFAQSPSGSLPDPLDTEHVMRAWRFGFVARCAEMSLPASR